MNHHTKTPKAPVPMGLNLLENNQHDPTFKAAMALPHIYLPFFERHLPAFLTKTLDSDSIEPIDATFVDEQLKASLCDKVFKARFASHPGYLVILAEHQSTASRTMPLRLMRYLLNILEHAEKDNEGQERPLPLVYPLVFYHNPKPYGYSTDIKDLINAPPELIDQLWGKPFHPIDLTQMKDEELLDQGDAGVLQYALKHIWAARFTRHFRHIVQALVTHQPPASSSIQLLRILLQYTECRANITKKDFIACIEDTTIDNDVRSEVMTVLEQVKQEGMQLGIQQGMQHGVQEGITKGQRKVALHMLWAGVSMSQVMQWTGLAKGTVQQLAEKAESSAR